jgi:endonuclease/exonuclease/phosphatase family metal-dependent hydrolase
MAFAIATIVNSFQSASFAEEITIGAWNIEWLGLPDMRGRPSTDIAQKPSDLGEWIDKAGVDVLALEEIGVESTDTRRSDELDATFEWLKENRKQDWKYVLFPKTEYTEPQEDFVIRGQHIGLAWRTDKATQVGEPFNIDVGANETYGYKFWERRANALKLSFGEGKSDAVFIPVHLKSNSTRSTPSDDPNWTRKHRAEETRVLIEKMKSVQEATSDSDIIILGDFNFLADDDAGPTNLVEGGFIDLNQKDDGTTANWGEGYSSAPFDRIFVAKGQPEFEGTVQTIVRAGTSDDEIKAYRKRFSDHYLVTAKIKITKDDD